MSSCSRIDRRRALRLLAAIPAALLPAAAPRGAAARRTWCRVDPVVKVDGQTAHVWVAVRVKGMRQARALATGPTRVVLRVPPGVEARYLGGDNGFGFGYEVAVAEDGALAAGAVEVAVYVPMRDGAVPIRAGFVARGRGPHGAAEAEGAANAWLTFRADAGEEGVCEAVRCPQGQRCCPGGRFAGRCRRGACP